MFALLGYFYGKERRADFFLIRLLPGVLEYLGHFARLTKKENVEAVERLLASHLEFAKFEKAQLGTYIVYSVTVMFTYYPNIK